MYACAEHVQRYQIEMSLRMLKKILNINYARNVSPEGDFATFVNPVALQADS